ncbi:MAG: hypothetical protein K2K72_04635, partial [Duncaniella sp.]|nr:hypothetical protein [Duncaniella sp.]
MKSITDNDGNKYPSYPAKSVISASDLAKGKCFTVTSDEMSKIRTGRLALTVNGDPSLLKISLNTGVYTLTANMDGLKDGKGTISYDPATESNWIIYRTDAKEIFKVTLDDNKIERVTQFLKLNPSENTYSIVPIQKIDLKDQDGTHDLTISIDFPKIEIPVKFEFENIGGNETNPAYLADMIESITVNSTTLTDKSWLNEDFTVTNGSKFYVSIKPQARGLWEFGSAYFNGEKLSSAGVSVLIEGDDATPQTFKINGKLNNYWRYTLNLPDLANTMIQVNDILEDIDASPYHGTSGFTPPVLKPYGKNGYKVYDVEVDGQTVPLDEKGTYTITKMDEEITITPRKYERNVPLQIYCDYGNYSNYYIILDPLGQTSQRVDLTKGLQTVMINPDDFPCEFGIEDSYIYVNDQLLTEKDEHGLYTGLKGLTAADHLSIFVNKPRTSTLTHKAFPAGVTADIYHNGVKIDGPGVYNNILPGTIVKYVPTSGSDLVLENVGYSTSSFIKPAADGSFEFTANYSGTYWLHGANPTVSVTIDSEDYSFFRAYVGDYTYMFNNATETLALPYSESQDATFDIRFTCDKNNVKVKSVTATPDGGVVFNDKTATVSGVKDGMKLSVGTEKFDKMYNIDFYCNLPPGVEIAEGSDPRWPQYTIDGNTFQMMPPINLSLNKTEDQEWTLTFPVYFGWTSVDLWKEYYNNSGFEGITELDFPITLDFSALKSCFSLDQLTSNNYKAVININGVEYDLDSIEREITDEFDFTSIKPVIIIEEPQDIRGSISVYKEGYYNSYNGKRTLNFEGGSVLYSFNNGEVKTSSTQSIEVLPGSRLEVWLPSGKPLSKCTLTDRYNRYATAITTDIQPDENNHYIIEFAEYDSFAYYDDYGSFYGGDFTLSYEQPKVQINVTYTGGTGNLLIGGVTLTGSQGAVSIDENSSTVIKCANSDYRVIEVVDKATGTPLELDITSGKVSGITAGMAIEVKAEKYERDKTVRFYFDNTAPSSRVITLAAGTAYEKTVTLPSTISTFHTVNYNVEDLPLKLNIYYSNYGSTTYPVMIMNNQIVTHLGKGEYDLPAVLPDNAIIRLYNGTTRGKLNDVIFNIENGVDISVTQDGVAINDPASTQRLATGVEITFTEKPENKFDYEILQGSTKLTAKTVKVPNSNTTFTVRKTYNTLTLAVTGDADLSALSITDTDGNIYTVESGNTIKVPTRVKSLTFSPTVEDIYFAESSVTGGSMKFDKDNGELSDITSGTLSLTIATVKREQEVNIYLENSEELAGAQITLGNGKVIETGVSLSGGSQTVQFSEEDLPIIFKLPESYLGDGETPADPSQLPAVFVNDQQLEYSEEHGGYVFPTDAFADPSNPPSIKIYPAEPAPTEITYLVEPGITFSAVADKDADKTVTEASTVELLPGTQVEINATATKSDEIIFIEIEGETIMEGSDLNYIFTVGSSAQTIEIKRRKVSLTVKCDEEWNNVRVDGAGFSYPMYAAESELEFPVGTTQVSLRSTNETRQVIKVINAADDSELTFDAATGLVSGIADKMQISLGMGA